MSIGQAEGEGGQGGGGGAERPMGTAVLRRETGQGRGRGQWREAERRWQLQQQCTRASPPPPPGEPPQFMEWERMKFTEGKTSLGHFGYTTCPPTPFPPNTPLGSTGLHVVSAPTMYQRTSAALDRSDP